MLRILTTSTLLLLLAFSGGVRADEETEAGVLMSSMVVTLLPTGILLSPFQLTGVSITLTVTGCIGPVCKTQVIKRAAIEAGEYLNGEAAGPHLMALQRSNPDKDLEEVIDIVLHAAEQL